METRRASAIRTVAIATASSLLAFHPHPARGAGPAVATVTRYDLATRDDLLFAHLLTPMVKGEVADWPILKGLGGQVGDWVDQAISARQVASLITESFPIEGQPALGPVRAVVADCARTLGLEEPEVHVRNSPFTQAYTARAFGRDHLVLTSGLINRFAARPEELKFVVGRELGHVKCGHAELRNNAIGLLSAVQAINLAIVPDRFQSALPTLGLARLYAWCRESEVSADRAGLLCCGEPRDAYAAVMRLQHGLDAGSPWIDPEAKDFDAEAIIRSFQAWQRQPFVKLVVDLKRHTLENPFVPERLAALRSWSETGAPRAILARKPAPASGA